MNREISVPLIQVISWRICTTRPLAVTATSSTLAMMELKGMVRSAGNMFYVLARETRELYGVKVE
jgi:hypothetical protein